VNINLEIDDDIIRDAVGGAAIGYWASTFRWVSRDKMMIRLLEGDTGMEYVLAPGDFQRGVQIMLARYPRRFADLVTRNGDATTGDLLVQCAAFGEEKYA